jgi:hypothetical protein
MHMDTFFSVFDAFFSFLEWRIAIVKLVQLCGSLRHEYNNTQVIYRRKNCTTFYLYELRTFCANISAVCVDYNNEFT